MVKKIDQLKDDSEDPYSPKSQEFLQLLQKSIIEHREKMKKIYASWADEDRKMRIIEISNQDKLFLAIKGI
jgi:hypothetical protein